MLCDVGGMPAKCCVLWKGCPQSVVCCGRDARRVLCDVGGMPAECCVMWEGCPQSVV